MSVRNQGREYVFSHELASAIKASPARVRRDLMPLSIKGIPQRGYRVEEMLDEINKIVRSVKKKYAALVGVGNLGRAILSYFIKRRPNIEIIAAFDDDEAKVDRVLSGCKCYHISKIGEIIKKNEISVGILTVPASDAQDIAESMVRAGVRGIVNFAPTKIHISEKVFIENIDITTAIEKTAYFAELSVEEESSLTEGKF